MTCPSSHSVSDPAGQELRLLAPKPRPLCSSQGGHTHSQCSDLRSIPHSTAVVGTAAPSGWWEDPRPPTLKSSSPGFSPSSAIYTQVTLGGSTAHWPSLSFLFQEITKSPLQTIKPCTAGSCDVSGTLFRCHILPKTGSTFPGCSWQALPVTPSPTTYVGSPCPGREHSFFLFPIG